MSGMVLKLAISLQISELIALSLSSKRPMLCFVCLSLCDSGQGDNRLVFRGAGVWWGSLGRGGGGGSRNIWRISEGGGVSGRGKW